VALKKKRLGVLRNELRDGIRDLEEFAQHIGAFATWWNWMVLETIFQDNSTQKIQFNYDSLRLTPVISKWEALKKQFADYTDQV
jgi:hypothetical protein